MCLLVVLLHSGCSRSCGRCTRRRNIVLLLHLLLMMPLLHMLLHRLSSCRSSSRSRVRRIRGSCDLGHTQLLLHLHLLLRQLL